MLSTSRSWQYSLLRVCIGPLHVADVLPEHFHVPKTFEQLASTLSCVSMDGDPPPTPVVDPKESPSMGFHPTVHVASVAVGPTAHASKAFLIEVYDTFDD